MINYENYSNLFYAKWSIYEEEKPTWEYIKTFLSPNCVFLDIGCQKGIFSEGVLDLYGKNCQVFAFDVLQHPNISNIEKKFNNFYFLNSAVGDGQPVNCMIDYESDTFVDNQKSITLDKFCEDKNIPKIDFIKIDVDGTEKKVLYGSVNTLKKYSPVLMVEIVNSDLDHQRLKLDINNKKECIDILNSLGYVNIGVRNDMNYFFEKKTDE